MDERIGLALKEIIDKQNKVALTLYALSKAQTTLMNILTHSTEGTVQAEVRPIEENQPPRYEGNDASGPGWFYVSPKNIGEEPKPKTDENKTQEKKSPIQQITEFCRMNNIRHVDPNRFFTYYNDRQWKDKEGKKIKNWKSLVISWENRAKKELNESTMIVEKSLRDVDKIYETISKEYK